MKKWLVLLLYAAMLGAAFAYRHELMNWLKDGSHLSLSFAAAVLLAIFPVLPYKAVIGFFGFAYGTGAGALITWSATTLAAALMFGAVRFGFRGKAEAYLTTVRGLGTFTAAVRKRPFAAVVAARLLPVIPQAAVNAYAGAAGLPFGSFMAATAVGKIPGIFVFAFLGGNLSTRPRAAVLALLIYAAVLGACALTLRRRPADAGGKNDA